MESFSRVTSRDGTEIAFWPGGDGTPLLLVHGALSDHTRWAPLLPYLEPHASVATMDRRGRGASGDGPDYQVAREFEDVAAVVDELARSSGSRVAVYGHSFGATCAIGAALLTGNAGRLVLYEPSTEAAAGELPAGVVDRLEAELAQGDREAALDILFREVVMLPDEQVSALREQPAWKGRVAAIHTVPRELAAEIGGAVELERLADVTVPVLLVNGGESPDYMRSDTRAIADALANARVIVLEGQDHVGDVLAPEVFAEAVIPFLRET
ncbi:MAG TPA: alpha/beta hydrolase [Actinomycetota bacterium]|nr:alpha/beta hydrolase [Actinomycetota bacterium]